jgi:hypothetical protein
LIELRVCRIVCEGLADPCVNVASPRTAGLCELTETLHQLQVVCEAGNAAEAIGIVRSLVPEHKPSGTAGLPVAVL